MPGVERSGPRPAPRRMGGGVRASDRLHGLAWSIPNLPTLSKRRCRRLLRRWSCFSPATSLCMALAMLATSTISSLIGVKRTLIAGLVLIIAFSALAGSSGSIGEIVGFRAAGGSGTLFAATALAAIVGAASGNRHGDQPRGRDRDRYRDGPDPRWRPRRHQLARPFLFLPLPDGIASWPIFVTLPRTVLVGLFSGRRSSPAGLRDPGLRTMAITAASSTTSAFTSSPGRRRLPSGPMHTASDWSSAGWGIGVALTSVFVAPRLRNRFGTLRTTHFVLASIAILMLIAGIFGQLRGRPDRGRRRFRPLLPRRQQRAHHPGRDEGGGGGAADRFGRLQLRALHRRGHRAFTWRPRLAEIFNPHVPCLLWERATILLALVVLLAGSRHLARIDAGEDEPLDAALGRAHRSFPWGQAI